MPENRIFTGGLDQDSSQELIANGDYPYALNCRVSTVGNIGKITNALGTIEVSIDLPSGENQTIGSYQDKLKKKLYYFLYNSQGSHGIYEFDGNAITLVIQSDLFNFSPDYKITGVTKIDNLLYWTDNNNESMVVDVERAKNGEYEQPYKIEYFTQIRKPPLNPPTATYVTDGGKFNVNDPNATLTPGRKTNYVINKLFQFKTRFTYSDNSKSVTSPVSLIPFPTENCNGSSESGNNAIDITMETGCSEVKKIELFYREGNEGDFYLIDTFIKAESGISSDSVYTYRWYNDGVYNTLNLTESIQLYDAIPSKYEALDLIPGNRIARANGVDLFDQVDVNAAMVIDYEDNVAQEQTFNITGRVYIKNIWTPDNDYANYQPITRNEGDDYPVFGGYGTSVSMAHGQNAQNTYGQILPLGGFVVYLAGTTHFAVTQQNNQFNLPTDSLGAFTGYTAGQRNTIRSHIEDNSASYYSTFTIQNVPRGAYILRVAGVRMPNGNPMELGDLSASLDYQTTSTYTIQVGGVEGTEFHIPYTTAGTVNIGDTYVCDMIDILPGTQSSVIDGYIVDKDKPTLTGTQIMQNDRIELSVIDFKRRNLATFIAAGAVAPINISVALGGAAFSLLAPDFYNTIVTGNEVIKYWNNGRMIVDHNGFFFFAHRVIIGGTEIIRATCWTVLANEATNLVIKEYNNPSIFDQVGTPNGSPNFSSAGMRNGYIVQNTNNNVTDYAATHISGTITDGTSPIANVSVVSTNTNRIALTNNNGIYRLRVFGQPTLLFTRNNRVGNLYFKYEGQCIATVTPAVKNYNVKAFNLPIPNEGTYNNNINNDYTIVAPGTLAFLSNVKLGFKHGGAYRFGIVYADQFGRLSTTMTNDWETTTGASLNVNIPTEQEPGGDWGMPKLRMSIFNQAPSWAKKYYIVRTKNAAMNTYMRFLVNCVNYYDDDNNITSQANATKVALNFYNIIPSGNEPGSFYDRFPGSLLTLSYVKGMRIRFIMDANGNYYNGYYDFAVTGNKSYANLEFYLENAAGLPTNLAGGALVEIYVPKLQVKEQLFYEVAAVGDIVDGYHMGINGGQNQTATQEAIAKIEEGDTYYRVRNMPYFNRPAGNNDAFPDANTLRRVLIEDPSYSDFYDLKVQNIGRPSASDKDIKQVRRETSVWYSGKYLPDTTVNNLSTVTPTSYVDYPKQYGPISKLYSGLATGDTMGSNIVDVYQKLRVGSILVDEFATTSPSSQQGFIAASSNVLSQTIKYYQGEIGLSNPESFAHYTQRRYFADSNSQQMIRLSGNGLEPISDYKMTQYFFDKLEYVRQGKCTMCAGYDTENMEYYAAFSKVLLEQQKTSITETPFETPVTNGEFTTIGAWDENTMGEAAVKTQALAAWSIPAPLSWNTPGTYFYDYFVNVTPSYNPNDKAFFTMNPGSYIAGDTAELISDDTFYQTGTTYKFEMKFDNLSFGIGLNQRVIGLRIKLGDTISDLITASPTNVSNYSGVVVTRTLEATGVNPKLSIVAEVTQNVYIDSSTPGANEYTHFVAVDYIKVLSTIEETFAPASFLPAETLTFYEGDNRWKSFWSFNPEWMDGFGVKLVSWINGKLNVHNVNESYGSQYGTFRPAELHVVSNAESFNVKTYLTIGENANKIWEAYEITTPADEAHPNGQLTESLKDDFVMREGVYYAPILRDANTPNVQYPLIEGEPIKGRTAKFKLRNSDNTAAEMYSFNINVIASERSNK